MPSFGSRSVGRLVGGGRVKETAKELMRREFYLGTFSGSLVLLCRQSTTKPGALEEKVSKRFKNG